MLGTTPETNGWLRLCKEYRITKMAVIAFGSKYPEFDTLAEPTAEGEAALRKYIENEVYKS